MVAIRGEGLTFLYDKEEILKGVNIEIIKGEITSIIGANGCGKSTLLKNLTRIYKPKMGRVLIDFKDIKEYGYKGLARKLAILPQGPQSPEGITVEELCYFGRNPYRGFLKDKNKRDREMVEYALSETRLYEIKNRRLNTLSGGQRQMAWIAMSLVQETDILLLDEPTTYLDLAHQIEILELLNKINKQNGKTIVMVIHDINQAAKYSHNLITLVKGEVYSSGKTRNIFTEQMIRDVFSVNSRIIQEPVYNDLLCIPIIPNYQTERVG